MGHNSLISKIGDTMSDVSTGNFGAAWSDSLGSHGLGGFIGTAMGLGAPKAPTLATPTTSQPTLAQTNTTALQNQLLNEQNSLATSTVLLGGRGVVAGKSATTSQMLLGS